MRLFKGGENKLGLFQKGSVQQVIRIPRHKS
jgi:hypothetical protein